MVDMAALWEAHRVQILRYIRSKIGDIELSQDLQAEVFARAMAAQERGSGPTGNIAGWLHRIAHNLIVDHLRKRNRRPHEADLDDAIELPSRLDSPHAVIEAADRNNRLWQAIRRLTAEQQTVIRMRMAGYAYDEIAEHLEKTGGAAKTLHYRAKIRLQELLQEG